VRASPWLREILTLDPERDAQRIVRIDTVYEFPFDTTRSLEFALFRTFGSPAVSRLLDETQEFALRAQRREQQFPRSGTGRRSATSIAHRQFGSVRLAPNQQEGRAP